MRRVSVAKKKTSRRPPAENAETVEIDESVEQSPKVRKAADAVQRAMAELHNAQELYEQMRLERVTLWKDISRLKQSLPEVAQNYLAAYRKVAILEDDGGDMP